MSLGLEGCTALVTGAAHSGAGSGAHPEGGIGYATALLFAELGLDLLLVDRDEAGLAAAGDAVRELGATCTAVACDLSSHEAVIEALGPAIEALPRLDVLASVAGTTSIETSPLDFVRTAEAELGINYLSHVWLAEQVVPKMVASGSGSIVFVSSDAHRVGAKGCVSYSAAKGALASLTRSLAWELGGSGIRVNCVSPGPTHSPLRSKNLGDSRDARFSSPSALQRIGGPREQATTIAFFSSPLASYVTGQTLSVNGGLHMF